ncbi:MAG: hypothetical protein ACI8RD_005508 [Bacillariaceae sp.]|jgi:hypothetical protein
MVVLKDFEFQLVSADDDANTPFKEHEKNLKTYVEVEPDAEYFLSIRKVRASSSLLYCRFYVDDKALDYHQTFKPNDIHSRKPKLCGLYSMSNGIRTYTALQFMKASFTTSISDGNIGNGSTLAGMGDIKMVVSQGIPKGKKKRKDRSTSSFTASSINFEAAAAVTMKKNLRSGTGSSAVSKARDKVHMSYGRGKHLYTITLHYCATPGLIAVGILPKPPLWVHARMLHPATTTVKEKKQIEKGVVSMKNKVDGKEILEINDDSDIEGDDFNVDDDTKGKTDKSNDKKEKKSVKGEINI